jgi:hypothetical protein
MSAKFELKEVRPIHREGNERRESTVDRQGDPRRGVRHRLVVEMMVDVVSRDRLDRRLEAVALGPHQLIQPDLLRPLKEVECRVVDTARILSGFWQGCDSLPTAICSASSRPRPTPKERTARRKRDPPPPNARRPIRSIAPGLDHDLCPARAASKVASRRPSFGHLSQHDREPHREVRPRGPREARSDGRGSR